MIHPTAIIEEGAMLGSDVFIGPYCIIGKNVKIGNGTKLTSHVVVDGHTDIGANNEFHQFSSIGVPPQDKSYKNEKTLTLRKGNDAVTVWNYLPEWEAVDNMKPIQTINHIHLDN